MTAKAFQDWDGGKRPCAAKATVEVRYRNGKVVGAIAGFIRWTHDANEAGLDVLGWREVSVGQGEDGHLARLALKRLTAGDDPMLDRAHRIAAECVSRGAFGGLAVDEYSSCGRVMVPTDVLLDLLTVAREA